MQKIKIKTKKAKAKNEKNDKKKLYNFSILSLLYFCRNKEKVLKSPTCSSCPGNQVSSVWSPGFIEKLTT